ncbi:hypothetical protein BHM03_00046889 [Ensete ventricosum]|nr:hypothetical protein BHM03_00046889 [Ensete ventricosum]
MPHALAVIRTTPPSTQGELVEALEAHPRESEDACPKKKPKLGMWKVSRSTVAREVILREARDTKEGLDSNGSGARSLGARNMSRFLIVVSELGFRAKDWFQITCNEIKSCRIILRILAAFSQRKQRGKGAPAMARPFARAADHNHSPCKVGRLRPRLRRQPLAKGSTTARDASAMGDCQWPASKGLPPTGATTMAQ